MTDFYLIVFLDNQNLGIDTEIASLGSLVPKLWHDIGFLSGTVSKLLDIWYFCTYAN